MSGQQIEKQATIMEKQTEALIAQTKLNIDLLGIEKTLDQQSRHVSAFMIAKVEQRSVSTKTKLYSVNIQATFENHSSHPVYQIKARLTKRRNSEFTEITLDEFKIPISVIGPDSKRKRIITHFILLDEKPIRERIFIDKSAA